MMRYLYHYTSLQALNGIIPYNASKLVLHASVASSMNDPTEVEDGYNCLFGNESFNGIEVASLREKLLKHSQSSLFFISFSKEKDSLPMWISYAENGTGICLGLQREVVENGVNKCLFGRLIDALYSDKEKSIRRKKIIDILQCNGNIGNDQINAFIFSCKNDRYSFEKEVRYCFEADPDSPLIKMRARSDGIVCYLDICLPLNALSEIIIGPKASPSTKKTIEDYLPKNLKVNVRQSAIPYR